MNAVASECSSGCESGWTVYLEQSFLSPATTSHTADKRTSAAVAGGRKERNNGYEEEQEDDLSMLSDASSGPPHFTNEDEIYSHGGFGGGRISKGGGSKRRKERKSRTSEKQEAVDDTASSPAFNLCKNNFGVANNHDNNPISMESIIDYSQDFSATHFKGESAYQRHFGYVQPSLSGNQLQNNQWY